MKKISLLITLLAFFSSYCQVIFEKGYYITNTNEKVECFIKNEDWVNAPKQITYKLSEDGSSETKDLNELNSFQIYNTSQYYIKHNITVDYTKEGDFSPKPETAFLKVLISGEASLYTHKSIFFYQKQNGEIKQLVYKRYTVDNSKIVENNSYRTELYNELTCEKNLTEIRNLKYLEKNLISFFEDYNTCQKIEYEVFASKKTKTIFNFNALAGVHFTKSSFPVSIEYPGPPSSGSSELFKVDNSIESGMQSGLIVGIELEALLPFNKNKWALFTAPTYQQLKFNESQGIKPSGTAHIKGKYTFIDLPIGIRHYFYLNEKSKLFIDGAFSAIIFIKKDESKRVEATYNHNFIKYESNSESLSAIRLGLGYKFDDKYALSFNYYPKKQLSQTETNTFAILASYKLF